MAMAIMTAIAQPHELEHALQLRYLDSPHERASLCILREVGVTVELTPEASSASTTPVALASPLLAEHTSTTAQTYELASGRVFVDVRDAGDAWVRCALTPRMRVTLTGATSRRFVLDRSLPSAHELRMIEMPAVSPSSLMPRFARENDALENIQPHSYRELVCELCAQFFTAGWVTGTGGSISIRYGNRIYMTPSGVPKERLQPSDLYLLDLDGAILDAPRQLPGMARAPKLSDCSPLFLHAYRLRSAGAVLHSHGMECNLVTTVLCGEQNAFRISHQEMIKGLTGYGFHDELEIPIIENTAVESDLADSLARAIQDYPRASAVLVRRHGIYVWGDSWAAAKRHAECLHYLFQTALAMHQHGVSFHHPPTAISTTKSVPSHAYVLLDIEGTTTPITFVHDVLFPFAVAHAEAYLRDTWTSSATVTTVDELRRQAEQDHADGRTAVPRIPTADGKDDDTAPQTVDRLIHAVVANVRYNVGEDRKLAPLKTLQGRIWLRGYASGELVATVYDDVPRFLARAIARGSRVGIYSSGSRAAQRLLFQHSTQGDLTHALSVYFDTTTAGHKRERGSYAQILESLGVDAERVLFVTDVLAEAQAAAAMGLHTALALRPGNAPLPQGHGFRTIQSFDEL